MFNSMVVMPAIVGMLAHALLRVLSRNNEEWASKRCSGTKSRVLQSYS